MSPLHVLHHYLKCYQSRGKISIIKKREDGFEKMSSDLATLAGIIRLDNVLLRNSTCKLS